VAQQIRQYACLLEEAPLLLWFETGMSGQSPAATPKRAQAGKLNCRTPQIEAEHGAKEVQFNSFDPANSETDITCECGENARSRWRDPDPTAVIRESFPIAVGGKTARSSGTESRAA